MEYQVIVSMTIEAASCLISRFPDFLCNGKKNYYYLCVELGSGCTLDFAHPALHRIARPLVSGSEVT